MKKNEKLRVIFRKRRSLDKMVERVRDESDIGHGYKSTLQAIQNKTFDKDKKQIEEVVITKKDFLDIIKKSIENTIGNDKTDKNIVAIYTLLSKDLDILFTEDKQSVTIPKSLFEEIDKLLNRIEFECNVGDCYVEFLAILQDEYYEGDKTFHEEGDEFLISSIHVWQMIEEVIGKRLGYDLINKYSIAVFSLLSKDLGVYLSMKNWDVTNEG